MPNEPSGSASASEDVVVAVDDEGDSEVLADEVTRSDEVMVNVVVSSKTSSGMEEELLLVVELKLELKLELKMVVERLKVPSVVSGPEAVEALPLPLAASRLLLIEAVSVTVVSVVTILISGARSLSELLLERMPMPGRMLAIGNLYTPLSAKCVVDAEPSQGQASTTSWTYCV